MLVKTYRVMIYGYQRDIPDMASQIKHIYEQLYTDGHGYNAYSRNTFSIKIHDPLIIDLKLYSDSESSRRAEFESVICLPIRATQTEKTGKYPIFFGSWTETRARYKVLPGIKSNCGNSPILLIKSTVTVPTKKKLYCFCK